MHRLEIAHGAVRDLDRIHEPDLGRIKTHILVLESNPRPHGVKKLDGPLHRIRAGNWRILYGIDDHQKVITILRIVRRSERTYKR